MDVTPLALPDVLLLKPKRFADARGWFEETWNAAAFERHNIDVTFVQDNQSLSRPVGTLRGLHFQRPPHAQAKLVRVAVGAVFDVAVDLRRSSPTYGQWVGATLTADGGEQLFVPRGFAHGFITRTPNTIVCYKVDAPYAPDSDSGVIFNDPDLRIDWGLPDEDVVLSKKDAALPRMSDLGAVFD